MRCGSKLLRKPGGLVESWRTYAGGGSDGAEPAWVLGSCEEAYDGRSDSSLLRNGGMFEKEGVCF